MFGRPSLPPRDQTGMCLLYSCDNSSPKIPGEYNMYANTVQTVVIRIGYEILTIVFVHSLWHPPMVATVVLSLSSWFCLLHPRTPPVLSMGCCCSSDPPWYQRLPGIAGWETHHFRAAPGKAVAASWMWRPSPSLPCHWAGASGSVGQPSHKVEWFAGQVI